MRSSCAAITASRPRIFRRAGKSSSDLEEHFTRHWYRRNLEQFTFFIAAWLDLGRPLGVLGSYFLEGLPPIRPGKSIARKDHIEFCGVKIFRRTVPKIFRYRVAIDDWSVEKEYLATSKRRLVKLSP